MSAVAIKHLHPSWKDVHGNTAHGCVSAYVYAGSGKREVALSISGGGFTLCGPSWSPADARHIAACLIELADACDKHPQEQEA